MTLKKQQITGNQISKDTSGTFSAELEKLSATYEISIQRAPTGFAQLEVLNCGPPTVQNFTVTSPTTGDAKIDIWKFMEREISTVIAENWCNAAKFVAVTFNAIFFDVDRPLQANVLIYLPAPFDSINMAKLCGRENVEPSPKAKGFV